MELWALAFSLVHGGMSMGMYITTKMLGWTGAPFPPPVFSPTSRHRPSVRSSVFAVVKESAHFSDVSLSF